jgi:hypothetical protein
MSDNILTRTLKYITFTTLGFTGHAALMMTWVGIMPGAMYATAKLTGIPSSTSMLMAKSYGLWYIVTRLLWMSGGNHGRWLRPNLPIFAHEWLMKMHVKMAMMWFRKPKSMHQTMPVIVCGDSPDGKDSAIVSGPWDASSRASLLPRSPVVFLNEPHGVGNQIFSTMAFIMSIRQAQGGGNGVTRNNSPVVIGSKNTCLVPFLTELIFILAGADGLEFAEDSSNIKRALASGRDVTLIPSGFSTIGTGGIIDWSKRKKFFQLLINSAREGNKVVTLQPLIMLGEMTLYDYYPKPKRKGDEITEKDKEMEKFRVKNGVPAGVFANGWCLPFFYLPNRSANLVGKGGTVTIDGRSSKDAAAGILPASDEGTSLYYSLSLSLFCIHVFSLSLFTSSYYLFLLLVHLSLTDAMNVKKNLQKEYQLAFDKCVSVYNDDDFKDYRFRTLGGDEWELKV